jgi:hypothetical protein
MSRSLRCRVAVLSIVARVAAADPSPSDAPPGGPPPSAPPPVAPHKSNGVAVTLSALGTVVPVAIALAGTRSSTDAAVDTLVVGGAMVIFTPSAGEWYAGRWATWGMAIRGLGAITFLGAAASCIDGCSDSTARTASIWGGIGLVAVGSIYDIATASRAVDHWNREHAPTVVPAVVKIGSGYGVGLSGAF